MCILYQLKVLSVKLGGVLCQNSDSKYPFIYLNLDNIRRYIWNLKSVLMC